MCALPAVARADASEVSLMSWGYRGLKWWLRWSKNIGQNGDLPIKNGDLPMKNGDLPMKNGDLPIKNGDLAINNEDFS